MATRGIRNNNPGNLRITAIPWQGKIWPGNTDGAFEQFTEMRYGIRAMMKDLINDYSEGKDTIAKLINEYAPSHENNTQAYIDSVANQTGIPGNSWFEMNAANLRKLARAIINHENGYTAAQAVTSQDIENAIAILGPVNLLETIVITAKKPVNWLLILGLTAGGYYTYKHLNSNSK